MDNFLDKYHLPRLNQDQISKLNRPITAEEIETVIKNLPTTTTKKPRTRRFQLRILPTNTNTPQILSHNGNRGNIAKLFHEAPVTLIPEPRKDITKKENYRPISLMNIDAKILNKILVNQIQEHIRTIIHHDRVSFIPEIQVWFNIQKSVNKIHHINKLKNMIISIDAEKTFDKIQHPFMIKVLERAGIQGTYLNITKAIYRMPTANIKLNGEKPPAS